MGLQIRRLKRENRVRHRVTAVKSVIGKLCHQVKDLFRRLLRDLIGDRTVNERLFVDRHLLNIFLAHRPPHQIGLTETISGQLLCELHDLLLIDEHAECVAENIFHLRQQIFGWLEAAMSVDKIIDHTAIERAGTI